MTGTARAGLLATLLVVGGAGSAPGQDPLTALLGADRAASDHAGRVGLAATFERFASDDLVYLHAGAPVLAGAASIRRAVAALPHVRWTPFHAEVSPDGTLGVVYGATVVTATPDSVAFGRYLAVWRRAEDAWRLVAFAQVGQALPALSATSRGASPRIAREAELFAEQDRRFAEQAGRESAAAAFATNAASDAVVFGAFGQLVRGPDAIRAVLSDGEAHWEWAPVAGGASADRRLGYTVGDAVIRRRAADGSWSPSYSKYLTLWRRGPDGTTRFLADGGSARPAPAGR